MTREEARKRADKIVADGIMSHQLVQDVIADAILELEREFRQDSWKEAAAFFKPQPNA